MPEATDALRTEVAAQSISVVAVEPGAFRTNADPGFASEPVAEPILEYHDMLEPVRAVFVEMDGVQPGDPRRGAPSGDRGAALKSAAPPADPGQCGYDPVIETLQQTLANIRTNETRSCGADFST